MAYAHDNGGIHRDLKPANVMVGKYGEVYAVDWGLAKLLSEEDDPAATMLAPPSTTGDGETPATVLTLEGDVIGTPAYMPPEQASGRISDVDKQSDIYSLGAILYEILTFRPPFEGENARSVIASVIAAEPAPPSVRASEVRGSISQAQKEEGAALPEDVPPDLEEIVEKAMARDKSGRYASVQELHEEVQRFLEGEKERERNHQKAVEKISEGKALAQSLAKMQTELEDLKERFKLEKSGIKHFWPMEKKSAFWDLSDRVNDLDRDVVRTFGEVAAKYQEALGFEYHNREARAALADLYWDQYMRKEKIRDENQMIYFERLVREYNDGEYDARLKGDGTLSVSTAAYACGCLAEGRPVSPGEIDIMGFNPYSDTGSNEPLRLKLHRPDCKPETTEGADVWLFRYVEKRKILIPTFPEGVEVEGATRAKVPADILDRCFDPGSPFRPGEGLYLGKTPVPVFSLPMGSYLLIIAKEGSYPARVPVHIARLGEEKIDLTLYRDGEIPDGFAQVPAGGFAYQGDTENPFADLRQTKEIGDFFMARFPITCAEYLEFLNDIAENAPEEAEKKAPRKAPTAGPYWPKDVEGKYRIPSEKRLKAAPDEFKNEAVKLEMSPEWWEENWPVMSISWEDAAAYAAWKTRRLGFLFSLPHEMQWEKAARGTDGRFYPWGEELDPTFCNMNQSHEGGPRPCGVDSFPVDESPCGIRGLGGNSCDMCLNDAGEEYPDWRLCRGGYWTHSGVMIRSSYRTGSSTIRVNCGLGARLACFPHAKVR
jgi:serine/threonine-protein kinase